MFKRYTKTCLALIAGAAIAGAPVLASTGYRDLIISASLINNSVIGNITPAFGGFTDVKANSVAVSGDVNVGGTVHTGGFITNTAAFGSLGVSGAAGFNTFTANSGSINGNLHMVQMNVDQNAALNTMSANSSNVVTTTTQHFKLNGTAPLNHTLCGNGGEYLDAAQCGNGVQGTFNVVGKTFGTTYTNSGPTAIYVSGYATTSGSSVGDVFCMVNNTLVYKNQATATQAGGAAAFTAMVPAGATYQCGADGAVGSVVTWTETVMK